MATTRMASSLAAAGVIALGGVCATDGATCPDVTGDGSVGTMDMLQVLQNFGTCPAVCPWDFNGDGEVDIVDLTYLFESWGPCPSARAGGLELFEELIVVNATTPSAAANGLIVTHVYATGPNVSAGDPLLLARDADIQAFSGTSFYEIGSVTPPPSFFPPPFSYASFVTMNELADYTPSTDNVFVTSSSIEGSWFGADQASGPTPPEREAVDISAVTGNPNQFGVLIAQITLENTGPTLGYAGTVRLYTSTHVGGSLQGIQVPVHFEICLPDLTGNGVVDNNDLIELFNLWGPCPGGISGCVGDFNFDGLVNEVDMAYLMEHFGSCPAPVPGAQELFTGIHVVNVTDADAEAANRVVTRIYATGGAIGDGLLLVHDADISVLPFSVAPFYQAFPGVSTPPPSGSPPFLLQDTFVTMNHLVDYTPLLGGNFSMSDVEIEGSWLADTPPAPAGPDGVLIAQITLQLPCTGAYQGTVRLYTSTHDGGSLQGVDASFHFICPDVTCDGIVDIFDLLAVLAAWGPCPAGPPAPPCPADLNGNGTVDIFDLLIVLANWGCGGAVP